MENRIADFRRQQKKNGTERNRVGEAEGESRGTKVKQEEEWMIREEGEGNIGVNRGTGR